MIVDEHRLVGEGLLALFRAAGGVEAAAVGAAEAVQTARQFAPDVVVIDVTLPDRGAFQIAREIRAWHPPTRVLFLDEAVRPMHVRAALEVEGCGYWTKHASFDRLAEAAGRVAAGALSFCPEVRRHLVLTPCGLQFQPSPDVAAIAKLTRRESQVLVLLAEGLSVKQCAGRMHLAPSTVDNHKSRLMKKLRVHKVTELIRVAVREGLVGER